MKRKMMNIILIIFSTLALMIIPILIELANVLDKNSTSNYLISNIDFIMKKINVFDHNIPSNNIIALALFVLLLSINFIILSIIINVENKKVIFSFHILYLVFVIILLFASIILFFFNIPDGGTKMMSNLILFNADPIEMSYIIVPMLFLFLVISSTYSMAKFSFFGGKNKETRKSKKEKRNKSKGEFKVGSSDKKESPEPEQEYSKKDLKKAQEKLFSLEDIVNNNSNPDDETNENLESTSVFEQTVEGTNSEGNNYLKNKILPSDQSHLNSMGGNTSSNTTIDRPDIIIPKSKRHNNINMEELKRKIYYQTTGETSKLSNQDSEKIWAATKQQHKDKEQEMDIANKNSLSSPVLNPQENAGSNIKKSIDDGFSYTKTFNEYAKKLKDKNKK